MKAYNKRCHVHEFVCVCVCECVCVCASNMRAHNVRGHTVCKNTRARVLVCICARYEGTQQAYVRARMCVCSKV